jgi:hypothetical protein
MDGNSGSGSGSGIGSLTQGSPNLVHSPVDQELSSSSSYYSRRPAPSEGEI